MTVLLEKAIEAMRKLPAEAQDQVARDVLALIEDEARWDQSFASTQSQRWLEEAGRAALEDYKAGKTLPYDPSNQPK